MSFAIFCSERGRSSDHKAPSLSIVSLTQGVNWIFPQNIKVGEMNPSLGQRWVLEMRGGDSPFFLSCSSRCSGPFIHNPEWGFRQGWSILAGRDQSTPSYTHCGVTWVQPFPWKALRGFSVWKRGRIVNKSVWSSCCCLKRSRELLPWSFRRGVRSEAKTPVGFRVKFAIPSSPRQSVGAESLQPLLLPKAEGTIEPSTIGRAPFTLLTQQLDDKTW